MTYINRVALYLRVYISHSLCMQVHRVIRKANLVSIIVQTLKCMILNCYNKSKQVVECLRKPCFYCIHHARIIQELTRPKIPEMIYVIANDTYKTVSVAYTFVVIYRVVTYA